MNSTTSPPLLPSPHRSLDNNSPPAPHGGFLFPLVLLAGFLTVLVYCFPNNQLKTLFPTTNGTLLWRFKTQGISFLYSIFYLTIQICNCTLLIIYFIFNFLGKVLSTPALGPDGTIYVGSNDGNMYAIDPEGQVKWTFSRNTFRIQSSPAYFPNNTKDNGGSLYFGSFDTYLYCVDTNGQLKWKYKTDAKISSSPAVDANGDVYVISHDGYLYALSSSGMLKYTFKVSDAMYGTIASSPSIDKKDGTVYVGSTDYNLYAIDSAGVLKWKFKTNYYIYSTPTIAPDGLVYFGSWDSNIYCVNKYGRSYKFLFL